MGNEHSLAAGLNLPAEGPIGSVSLTGNLSEGLWFGDIQVGTPRKVFQGMVFHPDLRSCRLTLGLVQWFLILAAAISSYLY